MVNSIYAFFERVGFTHPFHPAMTHAPMGMVIGMLLFGLLGLKWKDKHFSLAAYYCSVVAFITIFPTAFLGILDWLKYFYGEWYPLIIVKMILSTILMLLLALSIVLRKKGVAHSKVVIVYLLCMACACGIGYAGGDLAYG